MRCCPYITMVAGSRLTSIERVGKVEERAKEECQCVDVNLFKITSVSWSGSGGVVREWRVSYR